MKKILNAIGVVVLAAIGAGSVIYADKNCQQKQANEIGRINAAIANYVANQPQVILEKLAKTDNFGDVVKSFSVVSEEEINATIKKYIENNPSILEDYIRNNAAFVATTILETEEFKNATKNVNTAEESNNEETTAENQKYLDHWDEMRHSKVAPKVGPDDAKITVVEFFDFACGHCKALAPIMSQLIKNNPDVKFVFNPLYFISEHSPYAAKVSMAAAEKGKFLEVFEGIMTLPQMNEETINQILTDEGLDVKEVKKMIEEKKIRRGAQDIDALSQVLGINGVPMLLINGEPFYGRSLEDLQNKINSYK